MFERFIFQTCVLLKQTGCVESRAVEILANIILCLTLFVNHFFEFFSVIFRAQTGGAVGGRESVDHAVQIAVQKAL